MITRAPLSTAQRIAFASASTGIARRLRDDLRNEELRRGREPCDADPVVHTRADEPRDEGAVPERVACAEPPTKLSASRILPRDRGAFASTPESITATGIGSNDGSVSQEE